MTPRLRQILCSIGFAEVERANHPRSFGSIFRADAGKIFQQSKEVEPGIRAIEKLIESIEKLPPRIREGWEFLSRSSDDWDSGREITKDVETGAREFLSYALRINLDIDSAEQKPRNRSADAIAAKMAEIYVLARGKAPKGKGRSTDGHPSNEYTKAVADAFEELRITQGHRRSCERAIDGLFAENGLRLKQLLSSETRMALITGNTSKS